MKITFDTLGCKLNQAETESLARQCAEAGHTLVSTVEEADIFILNTCTVTKMADAKSRQLLRQAHRRNPKAVIVASGCYAERAPADLTGIDGVSLIANNKDKSDILQMLGKAGLTDGPPTKTQDSEGNYDAAMRTRSFIKIQDGCDNFCSYCIVPMVRGEGKSVSSDQIVNEINKLTAEGAKEVVLTGTEVGSYNHDGIDLKDLLERILSKTDIARLRLSSLQPQEISEELIKLWNNSRMCPHFHLSLQSGSDSVLERMNRQYSVSDYCRAVELIRENVPDAAITSDIIAGFPGETDTEFEESYNLCQKLGFARIHVFSYSPRPETSASEMTDRVTDSVRTQRNRKLRGLGAECGNSFIMGFSSRIMDVLWEKQSAGIWSGHTGNYIKVYTANDEDLTNRIIPAKLHEVRGDGVWGEVRE